MEVWCQTETTVGNLVGIFPCFLHFFGTSTGGTTANRPRIFFHTFTRNVSISLAIRSNTHGVNSRRNNIKNRIILVYFKFSSVKIAEIIVRKVQRILRKF
jgi:hypothetical protein